MKADELDFIRVQGDFFAFHLFRNFSCEEKKSFVFLPDLSLPWWCHFEIWINLKVKHRRIFF